MTHQTAEDAQLWVESLNDPLPGESDDLGANEIDQLKNL
jgi:hypothetical protein